MSYVIRPHVVARSLERLRSQKTHTLFAGYLCLQQRSYELNRLDDLQPEFTSFFRRFFRVKDHPLGTPYIKPFTERQASSNNLWLNENVAGSYAPSSLRPAQPFRKVVTISNGKFSLPQDHAKRAFEHLLYSKPVQVADLATVLYRDFALLGNQVTIFDVVDIFAYEFGYTHEPNGNTDQNFMTLYSLETAYKWGEDWLEPYE